MKKEYTHIKVYKSDHALLKKIASDSGVSLIEFIHEVAVNRLTKNNVSVDNIEAVNHEVTPVAPKPVVREGTSEQRQAWANARMYHGYKGSFKEYISAKGI